MAKMIYPAIMSLDGYIADEDGKFDWAVPERRCTASSTTSNVPSALPPGRFGR